MEKDINKFFETYKTDSLNLKQLILTLQGLTGDLSKKTLEENKELVKISAKTFNLIHGANSEHTANYIPLAIENELKTIEYSIRMNILKQMMELAKNGKYQEKTLKECWEDFIVANEYDYGSFDYGHISWSGDSVAPIFLKKIIPILISKVVEKLQETKDDNEKSNYIKMLFGIGARTNPSNSNHAKVYQAAIPFNKKLKIDEDTYV
jgi:hypothetical protein